jgi:outer membrane lipoprotein carrier protein
MMGSFMRLKQALFATLFIAISAGPTWATGLKSLEDFVKTVKSGKADFTQVVTSPAKEGQAPRVKTSSGTFEFSRPGRFRFNYLKPFAQTIVADGQTLWLYDVDLNQVTARQQSQVLGSTPAALIASAVDVKALQADFVLTDAPDQDGLQWVLASPKSKEGQLQSVRVGFRTPAAALPGTSPTMEALEILDSFGQRSVLTFKQFQANAVLSAKAFEFKVPAGADLLKQ